MLTGAILLLSFCLNVYALLKLRRATRSLDASHAALKAAISRLGPEVHVGAVQRFDVTPASLLDTGNMRRH